jgi:hypothetical protein
VEFRGRPVMSVDDIVVWEARAGPLPAHRGGARRGPAVGDGSRSTPGRRTGAARAGLTAGWASCLEGAYPRTFDPADVSGRNLVEVV